MNKRKITKKGKYDEILKWGCNYKHYTYGGCERCWWWVMPGCFNCGNIGLPKQD